MPPERSNISPTNTQTDNRSWTTDNQRGRGVTTIIKAYQGQPTFSGLYDEDLENIVELYTETAENCDATEDEKRKAMFTMLKGNARSLFARKGKHCLTFDDGVELLRTWFNSSDKESRLLAEWHSMKLTDAMRETPDAPEVQVFREFVDKLMSLQHQLHEDYHTDRYLRDRLMTAIDIPNISDSLKDRVPRNAHQLVNRVANRLSGRKNSSGTTLTFIGKHNNQSEPKNKDEALYSIGQNYGGEAKGKVKRYGQAGYRQNQKNSQQNGNRRRIASSWLRGVKGCFVCGKDHYANQKHPRDEVTAAINKLKNKHPRALLTVEDLAFITELYDDNDKEESGEEQAEWAEDDSSNDEEDNIAYIADVDLKSIEVRLSNSAFIHGMTVWPSKSAAIKAMYSAFITTGSIKFSGIRLDTCCNIKSIISRAQYNAYCNEFGLMNSMKTTTSKGVTGIGGSRIPIGSVSMQIPFTALDLVIDVEFIVLEESVPTLMSMKDMISNGLHISIQHKYICFGMKKQALKFENYFLIHKWSPADLQYALYTEVELRKIHKSFGHPSITATEGLLRRAGRGILDIETKGMIQCIAEECKPCMTHAKAPRRFKLTVGTGNLRFNHSVQVDTMFIRGKPVLHMVDLATHFCAAAFLKNQSTNSIWKTIQGLWNLVYVGPPDHLSVDQGTKYVSKEMRENLAAEGVTLHEAPVENPGTIGTVERYHAPLRSAYNKIRMELSKETSDIECLRMAVFAVNSTMGPAGLCPILLVFGVIPRPARMNPSITQIERSKAIDNAMIEVEKEQVRQRIAFGIKTRGNPKGMESSEKLRQLPAGARVLVYRTKSKSWEGPFTFISIEGETVVVQLKFGRSIFRSSCVKPYVIPLLNDEPDKLNEEGNKHEALTSEETNKRKKIDVKDFEKSRRQELDGLIKNGTFIPVDKKDIPEGARVFGSRFIDEIKRAGQGQRRKSRLVAQNYSDEAATTIATRAPTVQRSSQRLLLSLAISVDGMTAFSRDITQAYIQSDRNLERDVFIKAPSELNLPIDTVLKVVRPLYGIPESELHWYLTYLDHHTVRLKMKRTTIDPCMLVKHDIDGTLKE